MQKEKKNYKEFIKLSYYFLALLIIVFILLLMTIIFKHILAYNTVILILTAAIIIYITIYLSFIIIVNSAYKHNRIGKYTAKTFNYLLKIVSPVLLELAQLLKLNKDALRGFFVELNNIISNSLDIKCDGSDILLLVPHCLQSSNCEYKVTSNPENCQGCGMCKIKDLIDLSKRYNLNFVIATGGTLARKAVEEYRPKLIISVACNRDLLSGIIDVGNIPVIGVENKRPKGPCHDTSVDINVLEDNIRKRIKSKKWE